MTVSEIFEEQNFWFFALTINFFGGVRIRLGLTISIIGLNFYFFGFLLNRVFHTSTIYSSTDGRKSSCEIYWTGGERWRGTSLMVATRGFLMKSILRDCRYTCGSRRRSWLLLRVRWMKELVVTWCLIYTNYTVAFSIQYHVKLIFKSIPFLLFDLVEVNKVEKNQ